MATRTDPTYCTETDLIPGSVTLPEADATRYVKDAADEIDSVIGFIYKTPVVVSPSDPVQKPTGLLLKKINAWLATGRLIMAADSAGQDDQLQQYGKYLVDQALATLGMIADGSIVLPGIDLTDPDQNKSTGPAIAVADEYSFVEQFGATFGNPIRTVIDRPVYGPYYPGPTYSPSPYTY